MQYLTRSLAVAALAAVAAVAALAACGARPPATDPAGAAIGNSAAQRLAIAVIAPSSGDDAALGAAVRGATALAMSELDDEDSAPLPVATALLDVDAGSGRGDDVRRAADLVLARTDVVAVVAALDPSPLAVLAKRLAPAGITVITVSGPAPHGVIEVRPNREDEAVAAGRFVGTVLRARQPAVLAAAMAGFTETRAFTTSVGRFITAAVLEETYPIATKAGSGTDPLRALAAGGVDAIYGVGMPRQLGFALEMARARGLTAAFVVSSAWQDDADARDALDAASVAAYVVSPIAFDDGAALTDRFYRGYRQTVGGEPEVAAAMAFDAVLLAGAAIRAARADAIDPRVVGAAMFTVEVATLSGTMRIDATGRPVRPLAVHQRIGGRDRFVAHVDAN